MKTLDNKVIRGFFNIENKVPIYHTSDIVIDRLSKDNSVITREIINDSLPFDEIAVSVFCKTGDNYNDDYYFIFHKKLNERPLMTCIYSSSNTPVSKFDLSKDEVEKWMNQVYMYVMHIFSEKSTTIYLAETATIRSRRNGGFKRIKQKVVYIGNKRFVKRSIGFRINSDYASHMVSGHWRQIGSKTGHNRYGKAIKGKTWIRPYSRGEGAEIMETIRHWR